jgi:hypothetical protein
MQEAAGQEGQAQEHRGRARGQRGDQGPRRTAYQEARDLIRDHRRPQDRAGSGRDRL